MTRSTALSPPLPTEKIPSASGYYDDDSDVQNPITNMVSGELAELEAIRTMGEKSGGGGRLKKLEDTVRMTITQRALHHFEVMWAHPRIIFASMLVFALIFGMGLGIVFFVIRLQEKEGKDQAIALAIETGSFFCKCTKFDYLDQARKKRLLFLCFCTLTHPIPPPCRLLRLINPSSYDQMQPANWTRLFSNLFHFPIRRRT
jgi:hypothetical protein